MSTSSNAKDLAGWWEAGTAFFYPPVCQVCHLERASAAEGYVCPHCWERVRFIQPPWCERCGLPYEGSITAPFECANCREMDLQFRFARAAVVANEFLLEIIHRYKYQRALWFEPFLADLLARQAAASLRDGAWDMLVPIALHSFKEREREFNQAARLAARLGTLIPLRVETGLVRRVEATRTQTRLTRAERAANVRGAFAARPGVRLHGERIVLIDDVLTTGATASACAGALLAAGAGEVCVWTVARGL